MSCALAGTVTAQANATSARRVAIMADPPGSNACRYQRRGNSIPARRRRCSAGRFSCSVRKRIRPQLNVHGTRLAALAALHQPRRAIAVGAPQPAAFPAGVGIVDAPVEAFGIEADRIGNAQHHHLPILERDKAVVEVGGGDRNVLAETQRVVLVDPGVITGLGAGLLALEARAGIAVEGKALGTVIAGRIGSVERAFALAAVEADQAAVRGRTPHDAVLVDITA